MGFLQRFMPGTELPKAWLWILAVGIFVQLAGELFNNDGSRHATQTYLLLFVPALMLLVAQRFALHVWRQAPGVILLCLFAWVLLYGVVHPGSQANIGYCVKIVLLIVLYLFALASLARQPPAFNWLLVAVVIVVAAFAWATAYYQFGVLDKQLEYDALRSAGFAGRFFQLGWNGFADLKHPVIAGLYFGVFAVTLTYLFVGFKLRLWQAALLIVATFGVLTYVLLSFSRGSWFSTMAGGLVVLLLFPNMKSKSLIGLAGLVVVCALYFLWPEFQNERSIGLSSREVIWASWFERFPNFWLFGAGAGANFSYTFRGGFTVVHAHSFYLQLWFEYGIVGFLLFMMLLLSLLYKGWKCRANPLARLGLGLLVYAMVAMITDVSSIFSSPGPWWVVVWLPVGILLGVRQPAAARSSSDSSLSEATV